MNRSDLFSRAIAFWVALAVDLLWGEPPDPLHPVAWLGRSIGAAERRLPRQPALSSLLAGTALTIAHIAVAGLLGAGLQRALASVPVWPRAFLLGLLLKPAISLRALVEAGQRVEQALEQANLPEARGALRALVSRDASLLSPPLIAAAAIESLAENLNDSVIAPMLWYALFGLPGAYAYRAANTLDAMIGYRGEYEHLGRSSARLDDLLNLPSAPLSALLIALCGPLQGGSTSSALRLIRRDHGVTASPNAGWPMSAMSGALDVRLEKIGHYVIGAERPTPTSRQINQAGRLVAVAGLAGAALLSAFVLRSARGNRYWRS